jgi:anti-anti-sigma factor
MRCDTCPLQRPPGEPASEEELLAVEDCSECPLEHGGACGPETAAALVGQVRQLLQTVRQQRSRLKKANNEIRELREQARVSEEQAVKLAELHKVATHQSDVELRAKMELLAQQHAAIVALSTPIIQIKARTLVLPLIGSLDEERAAHLTHNLLAEVTRLRAGLAILDLTGVPTLAADGARHIVQLAQAVRLLGSEVMLCGLRPEVARSLVSLGTALDGLRLARSLQEALGY